MPCGEQHDGLVGIVEEAVQNWAMATLANLKTSAVAAEPAPMRMLPQSRAQQLLSVDGTLLFAAYFFVSFIQLGVSLEPRTRKYY
jgi:hypothetical protein